MPHGRSFPRQGEYANAGAFDGAKRIRTADLWVRLGLWLLAIRLNPA